MEIDIKAKIEALNQELAEMAKQRDGLKKQVAEATDQSNTIALEMVKKQSIIDYLAGLVK